MKILLIEDDNAMARSMELMLADKGCEILRTALGEDGIDLAKSHSYEIIILDLNLPDVPGLDVLKTLRAANIHTPVFIVSATTMIETKVAALRLGADDYMTKPFHRDEFVGRIQAVARRSQLDMQFSIITGKLVLTPAAKTVTVDGAPVHLTIKEYQLFELFSNRKGNVVSKTAILHQLYGGIDEPQEKIVDVFVCKLRKKLALATNGENCISTIWGHGYELRNPTAIDAAA